MEVWLLAAVVAGVVTGCTPHGPANPPAVRPEHDKQGEDHPMTQENMVSRSDGPAKPSDAEVAAAVRRSGDQQLAILLRDPGGYVLRPTELPGVKHHQVFRVMFTGTDHPMSFWLATDRGGGEATVLSQHLAGVAAFLRGEPELAAAPDLAHSFHELYRDQDIRSELLSAPAPVVDRRADGLHLRLAVRSDGRNELWKVDLPAAGAPVLAVEALP